MHNDIRPPSHGIKRNLANLVIIFLPSSYQCVRIVDVEAESAMTPQQLQQWLDFLKRTGGSPTLFGKPLYDVPPPANDNRYLRPVSQVPGTTINSIGIG
jgi:hypothetical protein